MEHIHLHILTPNKYKKRFFGVDYFMDILTGSNPLFKYYSTTLDANPVYKSGPVSFLDEMYDFLDAELSNKPTGSIIGIQNNPDIYTGMNSISKILELLEKHHMGLYLETTSEKILTDMEVLVKFSKNNPLLVAVPAAMIDSKSKLFGNTLKAEQSSKIIRKLTSSGIYSGMIIKPIIPMVNDKLDDFTKMLNFAFKANTTFIYLSASVKFDSKKIKSFYDIIDLEFPEHMVLYREKYGYKTAWESDNLSLLKKNYVILCKKNKVMYSMKDIINLYKPDLNIQLKLF